MEEIKIAQVILTNQKIQWPTGYACISVQLYFVKIKYQIVFSFISLSDGNIFLVLYVPSKCKERMRLQEQFLLMFLNAPIWNTLSTEIMIYRWIHTTFKLRSGLGEGYLKSILTPLSAHRPHLLLTILKFRSLVEITVFKDLKCRNELHAGCEVSQRYNGKMSVGGDEVYAMNSSTKFQAYRNRPSLNAELPLIIHSNHTLSCQLNPICGPE